MKLRRLLMIPLFLPSLAFAQQQYYGTPAARIQLSESADPADLDRIPIRPGQTITAESVRDAIQVLFNTGRYRTIDVDAVPLANGTQLTFNVTPHYFFSTFTLQPESLLDRPLSSVVRLPVGARFSETVVQRIALETRKLLEEAGYFDASVEHEYTDSPRGRLRTVTLKATTKSRALVSSVTIEGAENTFSPAELREALDVSAGKEFSEAKLKEGLAAIRKKFADSDFLNTQVSGEREYDKANNTVELKISVKPGPKTSIRAQITGDEDGISEDDIRSLVPVFEEGSFDEELLREGRDRIVEFLQRQGYFEAAVEPPQILPADADGTIPIGIKINTKERHKLHAVEFRGNTFFPTERLREIIRIRPGNLLNRGLYSRELVEGDVRSIQNLYRRAGFEAAVVTFSQDDTLDHKIDVVFDITENTQYPVESIALTGNLDIAEADLRRESPLKEGSVYSITAVEDAQTALMAFYYRSGYPNVRVEAAADRNLQTGARQVTFQIFEGQRYVIGEIFVTGNTRTRENVVKRGTGLQEYTPYNPEKMLEAQQRLYAKGLFRRVDVVPLDIETGDVRTVLIQVEEAKPIIVTPSLGLKEYSGPRVTLDVSHNNLFGLDRSLSFRVRWGVREQQFQTTYREPRLFNRENLDGFGSLALERTRRTAYEARSLEFALQVQKRLPRNQSLLWTASYQTVDLQDIRLNPIVRRDPDAEGVVHIARFGSEYVREGRDDILDPRGGIFTRTRLEVASRVWGSEVNFVSLFHQSNLHRKAPGGSLAFSTRVAWKLPYGVDDELPITERYFAGGSTTLRGFDLDEAGPVAGGQFMTIGNIEYRVPIKRVFIGELGGALFYDTGNVFVQPSDFSIPDFTHSAGIGIRYQTPLGPLRFDIGLNLHPRVRVGSDGSTQRERRDQYFFTLGHAF